MRALCVLVGLLAPAVSAGTREDVEIAWRGWFTEHRVGETELAIVEDGAVVLNAARDGQAGQAGQLASLSKAVTAACLRHFVDAGALSYDDRVEAYLSGIDGSLTIADLVTHRGGLWPDSTQERMWDWVNDPVDRYDDVTGEVAGRAPGAEGYRYNNENYALLGAVIAKVSGQSYLEACAERVAAPLGLETAQRSPRYGAFLPWGGWEMSAADYARFIAAEFDASYDHAAHPSAPIGGGARYGMGALFFEAEGLRFTWHLGLLCFGSIDGAGAYFVQVEPGVTMAVTFEGCPGEQALADLDQALLTAFLR